MVDISSLNKDIESFLSQIDKLPPIPKANKATHESGSFQAPIKGGFRNSGDYSPNRATDARHPTGHQGVDLRAPGGTSIYPLAPGVVTNVANNSVGGLNLNIDHRNGVRSYYAHLASINVKKGDEVDFDTVIGTVGDSGNAKGTAPHLHFQVWKNNVLDNPANYFAIPKYTNLEKGEKLWLTNK